jgi:hypothetical protein
MRKTMFDQMERFWEVQRKFLDELEAFSHTMLDRRRIAAESILDTLRKISYNKGRPVQPQSRPRLRRGLRGGRGLPLGIPCLDARAPAFTPGCGGFSRSKPAKYARSRIFGSR